MLKISTTMHSWNIEKLNHFSGVLFLTIIITFPRSFLELKLVTLFFFAASSFLSCVSHRKLATYAPLNAFYLLIAFGGAFWSLIGALNGGNDVGIFDSFRLYVIWSMAYLVLYTFLRINSSLYTIHLAFVLGGIFIAAINFYGIFDHYYGIDSISEEMRIALELNVGIHEGYVQINSHNIGSMFIVAPYLIAMQFRRDYKKTFLFKISLVLSLVVTVVSGRRALWISVAMTPIAIGVLSYVTGHVSRLTRQGKILIVGYILGGALAVTLMVCVPPAESDTGLLAYFSSAFSSMDERSIQKNYLFKSFLDYPWFGSGFGVSAIVPRNPVVPWVYESTYFQMLFNLGVVGVAYMVTLISAYIYMIVTAIRRGVSNPAAVFSLLVGLLGLLLGAYSNPYLGSFDFLIYLGLLPYLATFKTDAVLADDLVSRPETVVTV